MMNRCRKDHCPLPSNSWDAHRQYDIRKQIPKNKAQKTGSSEKGWIISNWLAARRQGQTWPRTKGRIWNSMSKSTREDVCGDGVLVNQNLHNLLLMLVNPCYITVHLPAYKRVYFHLLWLIRSLKHFYVSWYKLYNLRYIMLNFRARGKIGFTNEEPKVQRD